MQKVYVGNAAPMISNSRLLQIDADGSVCCELGMRSSSLTIRY